MVSIARDKLRALKQTSTISKYVQQFMTIKLSIPKMIDDEAVDKFLAGLKDSDARIHVKDVIDMNDPVLTEAIRAAHNYEGNRTEIDYTGGSLVDDPMDLSVAERRELYHMMKSWSNNGGSRGGFQDSRGNRGGFRGGSRGSYNGFRGGRSGQQQPGGGRGGRGRGADRANVQCHNCLGYGHYMRDCSSAPREQLNYAEYGDVNNDFDDDYAENKDFDSSAAYLQ
ncbi:hypothetical protein G6F42_024531 [Rhizopus arrhizus]|nr:hypothetical protein G6F42_024531 [Rhizopus arrhizus]